MTLKPFLTCTLLVSACICSSITNAKFVYPSTSHSIDSIADSKFYVEAEKVENLYRVKQKLNISGVSDHNVKVRYGNELNKQMVIDIQAKLKTLKNIQDKFALLMLINVSLKNDYLHLNDNFPLELNVQDKKYLDAIYTAYLSKLQSLNEGRSSIQRKQNIKDIEREIPFKFYDDDINKVQIYFQK